MTSERAIWDEGWVGKGVNGCQYAEPAKQDKPEVKDATDRLLLYVIEDGELYRLWYKDRIGFRR